MPICTCSVCRTNCTVNIGGVEQPGRQISNSLRLEHEKQDVMRMAAKDDMQGTTNRPNSGVETSTTAQKG